MISNQTSQRLSLNPAWGITACGAGLGIVLSWSVLAGDSQGRVNLLYLLLVYLAFPILSLVLSALTLIRGNGINLASLVTRFPIWSHEHSRLLHKMHQLGIDKSWLFYQSQLAALAFSFSSLLVLFLLLLATDINFVWRSTLLSAEALYPLLQIVATPWQFWNEAQPDLELLRATQDSRLDSSVSSREHANWWQFVVAIQLFYCILTRSLLMLFSRVWFRYQLAHDFESQLKPNQAGQSQAESFQYHDTNICHQVTKNIVLTNWCGLNLELLQSAKLAGLEQHHFTPESVLTAGPLVDEANQRIAERWQGAQLVLVKAWEPPMKELEDYLENGHGYIFPIDWKQQGLTKLTSGHLAEWYRFADQLADWQLYVPTQFMPEEDA